MKRSILIAALIVSGCSTTPVSVTRHFPDAPIELKTACPPLQTIDPDTTKLSDVVTTVVTNYGQYHDCSDTVDGWNEWYATQKKIFESVK